MQKSVQIRQSRKPTKVFGNVFCWHGAIFLVSVPCTKQKGSSCENCHQKFALALYIQSQTLIVFTHSQSQRLTFIRVFSDNSGTTNVIVPSMSVTSHTEEHVQAQLSGSLSRRSNGCLQSAGGAIVSLMLARLLHAWNWLPLDAASDKVPGNNTTTCNPQVQSSGHSTVQQWSTWNRYEAEWSNKSYRNGWKNSAKRIHKM